MLGTLTKKSRFVRLFCFFKGRRFPDTQDAHKEKLVCPAFSFFGVRRFPDTRDAHKEKLVCPAFLFFKGRRFPDARDAHKEKPCNSMSYRAFSFMRKYSEVELK